MTQEKKPQSSGLPQASLAQCLAALNDNRVLVPVDHTDGVSDTKMLLRKLISGEWALVDARAQYEAEQQKLAGDAGGAPAPNGSVAGPDIPPAH